MQFFDQLGARIERRWREKNYDEWAFPGIAAEALAEAEAVTKITPQDIIQSLHERPTLPQQFQEQFSDLPVTLYRGPRFAIDVYFWLDGTTTIHEHSFSGAFQVLEGSSIHNVYKFEQEQPVNAHFLTGQVLLREVQGLKKGDIREISPGRKFIHSLFHLDRPSVTITVRTLMAPNSLPQYNYLKPFFAINPSFKEQLTLKKTQSVALMLRMKDEKVYPLLDELIAASDFQTAFLLLSMAFEHLVDQPRANGAQLPDGRTGSPDFAGQKERFYGLLKRARQRHGALMQLLPPVLGQMQRERALVRLRSHVFDNEHRFFLALLLNVEQRPVMLELVKQRFPDGDPVDAICRWTRELSAAGDAGIAPGSIFGLDDFNAGQQLVFRHLLAGLRLDQIKLLAESDDSTQMSRDEVEQIYERLRGSILLKAIIADAACAPPAVGLS